MLHASPTSIKCKRLSRYIHVRDPSTAGVASRSTEPNLNVRPLYFFRFKSAPQEFLANYAQYPAEIRLGR